MFTNETDALLHKNIHTMPRIWCDRSLKYDIDDLLGEIIPGAGVAVIDDSRTAAALGDHVAKALTARFNAVHVTLDGYPHADDAQVAKVRDAAKRCDALVAVGGGTINDICKYASFQDRKPYVVMPTAASMNGYVSTNASITTGGYKTTLPAQMPLAVLCDMSVIASAPARLNKSGLGDSLARATAQADWLLSHELLGTPYHALPFALLEEREPQLFAHARGIAKGDMQAVELLLQVLLLSGFGMTIAGGSYPASQGEHMIAHSYEMLGKPADTLHGEEIGVTTLYMAQLQHRLLRQMPALALPAFDNADMTARFGAKVAKDAQEAYAKKQAAVPVRELMTRERWEGLAAKIEAILPPVASLQRVLEDADAPISPNALKWEKPRYEAALKYARFTRDRFTFLDIS